MAKEHWVGTWAVAPTPAEGVALNNVTLRMNGRVSLGGTLLRVRLTNAYGTKPLEIGAAHVGLRAEGAAVVPASNRKLTFGGESSAVIAAGALLISDPVELDVPALADIAVTVHLPQDLPASFGITGRYARVTNYISPLGNFADADVMPVGKITDDWHVVAGIDVLAEPGRAGSLRLVIH